MKQISHVIRGRGVNNVLLGFSGPPSIYLTFNVHRFFGGLSTMIYRSSTAKKTILRQVLSSFDDGGARMAPGLRLVLVFVIINSSLGVLKTNL
jgi:hypothetical protein